MPNLVVAAQRYVTVDHRQFLLHDFAWDDVEQPPLNADESPGVGERSVRVMSLIHDHDVVVDVQVWDGEPSDSAVPLVAEVAIESLSGIAVLAELMGGFAGLPIPLGMPGRYAVRIRRSLGFPAAERWQVNASGERDGLESYLLQLWRLPNEEAGQPPGEGRQS
ncbi:hypothetical protein [Streptomyces sp. NPDC058424]|uniref:hypothetical protein n=1 Tax=Streptomyces sp. NPDC058424 TaxID=3346491 RepID=UPI00365F428C